MRKICLYTVLALLFICGSQAYSQISLTGGGLNIGGGELTGSSSTTTTYHISPFLNIQQSLISSFSLRFFIVYNRDLNSIAPGTNYGNYFPYVIGGGISVFERTALSSVLKMEYGAGLLMLSDHTYSDIKNTGIGFEMNASLFVPLGSVDGNGWNIGAGAEYGQVFSINNPGYFSYFLSLRYDLLPL